MSVLAALYAIGCCLALVLRRLALTLYFLTQRNFMKVHEIAMREILKLRRGE